MFSEGTILLRPLKYVYLKVEEKVLMPQYRRTDHKLFVIWLKGLQKHPIGMILFKVNGNDNNRTF